MNYIAIFIVSCLILAAILILIILGTANLTHSSYGIRKKENYTYNYGLEYSLWFYKREDLLRDRYEDEKCLAIDACFEEYCQKVFVESILTYER